ncbi:hypothetical protein PLICRDRAFT_78417, partial [Plicaturopsis crispa FD-325 SS-3]
PASSPDVNPIEPAWHLLKNHVRHCPHPPSSVNKLRIAVQEAWDAIPDADILKLTETIVR